MKMKRLILGMVLCGVISLSCEGKSGKQPVNIVPQPQKVEVINGSFKLTSSTVIQIVKGSVDLTPACTFFSKLVERSLGAPLAIKEGAVRNKAINVTITSDLAPEAYRLDVNGKSIQIQAGSGQGAFYAFQTLRQMMPSSVEKGERMKSIMIQNVSIQDEPRLAYRGMHFDVCRHFFTVDEVKTFIDMLALHKLNRFHWHLTDDQGWRIEIKKYPKLTEIGGYRPETVIGRNSGKYDGKPYGPFFFTQEQVKEVVRYAADRYITVIPEIELPGHALAALASYPELGCSGGPYEVSKSWGVFNEVFCAGNDHTFRFFQDVFDEIIPLFPSEYFHIGGDECPKGAWKKCPKCQARMKQEHLKDEMELQSYFVHRVEAYLNSKGKKIVGWDEIMEGGLSKTATVMSWQGTKGGIAAAKLGNQVIMTPNNYAYFNYYQTKDVENEPLAIGGFVPVEKVYSLNPTNGLSEEQGKMVIGVQANTWSEYIVDFSHVQYMVLPRMAALAEVGWTMPEMKNYDNFVARALPLLERYDALGYNYAKHIVPKK